MILHLATSAQYWRTTDRDITMAYTALTLYQKLN